MGMSMFVYAATAQIGTLPLIVGGAPIWLVFLTGLILNVRFIIFSAAMAPAFQDTPLARRIGGSYLMTDPVFSLLSPRMLESPDREWRWGYYLAPSLYGWLLWQGFVMLGVLGAGFVPVGWSLEFMGTIALMLVLLPMVVTKPMVLSALVSGLGAVFLSGLPLRMGLFIAISLGIGAGFLAERHHSGRREKR